MATSFTEPLYKYKGKDPSWKKKAINRVHSKWYFFFTGKSFYNSTVKEQMARVPGFFNSLNKSFKTVSEYIHNPKAVQNHFIIGNITEVFQSSQQQVKKNPKNKPSWWEVLETEGKLTSSMFRSILFWTPLDVICTTSVQMLSFFKKKEKNTNRAPLCK